MTAIDGPWQSTKLMRQRMVELATPPRDDFDRAVLAVAADFDRLVALVRTPFASTLSHEGALERLRQINSASYRGE